MLTRFFERIEHQPKEFKKFAIENSHQLQRLPPFFERIEHQPKRFMLFAIQKARPASEVDMLF